MTGWDELETRRRASRTARVTGGLERARSRLEARLTRLVEPEGDFDLWLAALAVVTRALLRVERAIVAARRHNRRVAAKAAMLLDAGRRADVFERVGGEAALVAWEREAQAEAEAEMETGVAGIGPPTAVRAIAPIAEVEMYAGEAGFRLPTLRRKARGHQLPRENAWRGERPGCTAARRRNWMAGIEVWPRELREELREEMRRVRRVGAAGWQTARKPGHGNESADTRGVEARSVEARSAMRPP